MKVVSVEAFALLAEPIGERYWGARAWSSSGAALGTYPVQARRRYAYSATIDTVLVRVETADGVIGWGECKAPVAARVTAALVTELLTPLVVGTSVDEITVTWERMYAAMRVRGHDSGFWLEAIAGVDIALWDAWGHTLGVPVHRLLGGAFRTAVPVYASGIPAAPPGWTCRWPWTRWPTGTGRWSSCAPARCTSCNPTCAVPAGSPRRCGSPRSPTRSARRPPRT